MAGNSTNPSRKRKAASDRPKPYDGFPLTAHGSGYWVKKIRGKFHYFGRWAKRVDGKLELLPDGGGWQAALALYKAQADDLHAGRTPRIASGDELTIRRLCNHFRSAKEQQLKAGEITSRTYLEYVETTDRLVAEFGEDRIVDDLAVDDFQALRDSMARQWGPVRLGNGVQKVRTVFKYGYEAGLIDKPVRFGPVFKKPSASVLRKHRAKNGSKMLEADEVQRLLKAANVQLKAMVLLGVNCGFGNHDVATLPLTALDLTGGWITYPRPKTGIGRRCPLWPETVEALKAAIAERPQPRTEAAKPLVFTTVRGRTWLVRGIANPVSVKIRYLMKEVGIHRSGIGFYSLRHVFRTVADGARDQVAANFIMGHADSSMAGVYRERIEDERLKAVTDHVRRWLFPDDKKSKGSAKPKRQAKMSGGGRAQRASRTPDDNKPALRVFAG